MKIHAQIRRFTCCLNMAMNLKILKMSKTLYTESTADQSEHYTDAAFVRENVAYGYNVVMTFESLQPTPYC